MSSNDPESWFEAHAANLQRQAEEKRRAKQNPLPPAELAETSLALFRELLELAQVEKPDEWVYLSSLETVYNDDGDHCDVSNLRLVADYFDSLERRVESLVNSLAWSGHGYAKAALKLLTMVQLTLTERSNRERSEMDLGLQFDRVEPVVGFFRVYLERLRLMRSDLLKMIAEIRTLQEMDRSEETPVAGDALPKSRRADSPARIKARSAYDYAMQRIPDANAMTAPELFDAILDDGEAAEMLPPNADTFRRYLNDCGIRLKKSGPKAAGGSVVRRSDL